MLVAMTIAVAPTRAAVPWVVYYGDTAPAEAFDPYDVVVLDSQYHPPLQPLLDRGKTVLGYISLGEVEAHRPWFKAVRNEGLLRGENPYWEDSFYVDTRDRRWTERVLHELVPRILRAGFHGIFIDTLDNPAELERIDPKGNAGMTAAAASLVRAIRHHFPHTRIMLNRAYEILPEVAGAIDMVLGESVYADWNFEAEHYERVEADTYRHQVELLQAAQRRNPRLQVMTLDYWDPDDTAGIARIYAAQSGNGFSPYVATLALDRIVPRPR